jgi:hypothetical protein
MFVAQMNDSSENALKSWMKNQYWLRSRRLITTVRNFAVLVYCFTPLFAISWTLSWRTVFVDRAINGKGNLLKEQIRFYWRKRRCAWRRSIVFACLRIVCKHESHSIKSVTGLRYRLPKRGAAAVACILLQHNEGRYLVHFLFNSSTREPRGKWNIKYPFINYLHSAFLFEKYWLCALFINNA